MKFPPVIKKRRSRVPGWVDTFDTDYRAYAGQRGRAAGADLAGRGRAAGFDLAQRAQVVAGELAGKAQELAPVYAARAQVTAQDLAEKAQELAPVYAARAQELAPVYAARAQEVAAVVADKAHEVAPGLTSKAQTVGSDLADRGRKVLPVVTSRLPDVPDREQLDDLALTIAGPEARNIGMARIGFGATMVLRPRLLGSLLGANSVANRDLGWIVRFVGARDVALGVGHLHASNNGLPVAPWVIAGASCDVADAVFLVGAAKKGRIRKSTGVLFGVGAALCGAAAYRAVR